MWQLAKRNIWRKRGRSIITMVAMALVVLLTMLNFALITAMKNGIFSKLTATGGHFQVRVEDFAEQREFSKQLLRNTPRIRDNIKQQLPEAAFVEVLEVGGLLEGDMQRSRGIQLIGISQDAAKQRAFEEDYLLEGSFPHDVEGIALGVKLAQALKVELGDTVYMYTFNTEGYGASAYTVSALLAIPASNALAYVSLEAAQELAAPNGSSRLEVHLPALHRYEDNATLPALQAEVQTALQQDKLEGIDILRWDEVNTGLAGYLQIMDPFNLIFTAIFFILVALVVTNTIYLSVIERIREFGVMMAMGVKQRKIIRMVLFESLLLCGIGALVGALLGALTVWNMSKGFTFPGMEDVFADAGLPETLYASLRPFDVIATVIFVFITGIVAALIPARTAARLEPVEAMRFTA